MLIQYVVRIKGVDTVCGENKKVLIQYVVRIKRC